MIAVQESLEVPRPLAPVWAWLADLEQTAAANLFHVAVHFDGEQRAGVGARLRVMHGLGPLPVMPRVIQVTHWEPGVRLSWVEFDPRWPGLFPHSTHYHLAARTAAVTLLTYRLRGSFNIPLAGRRLEPLLTAGLVRGVVRLECATLRARMLAGIRVQ